MSTADGANVLSRFDQNSDVRVMADITSAAPHRGTSESCCCHSMGCHLSGAAACIWCSRLIKDAMTHTPFLNTGSFAQGKWPPNLPTGQLQAHSKLACSGCRRCFLQQITQEDPGINSVNCIHTEHRELSCQAVNRGDDSEMLTVPDLETPGASRLAREAIDILIKVRDQPDESQKKSADSELCPDGLEPNRWREVDPCKSNSLKPCVR